MALSCSLIRVRPRFQAYRSYHNNNNNIRTKASCSVVSGFSHFNNPHASYSNFPLPLRYRPLFSSPLSSFLRPCSSSLPRPLSSMTTPQDSSSTKTERVMIMGRVQGVFYRNWTVDNAKQLGLKGWVRNRRDGSVEALFSGSPDVVQEMVQRCRHGPPEAIVTGLEVFPSNDDPGTGFERKQTV
ncbi:PREDICTED: uncharacterized protein LOC109347598 [Lupinus angustifolius]|nr:PREDICTED: uncharacterized protein LOC109347598 [Lupinus angustifolius]XP_019443075.1 PREDICTED: uncharacterized protein LOC109347598 [Lupinus angustifolius]XP_019443076.1 PREDICTED: uncharacterized protein LOC109347598 [Lupinus angustifolius]